MLCFSVIFLSLSLCFHQQQVFVPKHPKWTKRRRERMKYPDLNICCTVFKLNIKEGRWLKKVFWKEIRISFFFLWNLRTVHRFGIMKGKKLLSSFISKHVPRKDETFIPLACTNFYSRTIREYEFYCASWCTSLQKTFVPFFISLKDRSKNVCLLCVFLTLAANSFKRLITKRCEYSCFLTIVIRLLPLCIFLPCREHKPLKF